MGSEQLAAGDRSSKDLESTRLWGFSMFWAGGCRIDLGECKEFRLFKEALLPSDS